MTGGILNMVTVGFLTVLAVLLCWLVAYSILWTIRDWMLRRREHNRIGDALNRKADARAARHRDGV